MGYEQLERSLIDIMKEEQAKLGYRKEQVRLYYLFHLCARKLLR